MTEAKEILSGRLEPLREFQVQVAEISPARRHGFALCVVSDEPDLLITSKVYKATFSSNNYIGITDESGEAAIYPAGQFLKLDFPSEVEEVLGDLQKAA